MMNSKMMNNIAIATANNAQEVISYLNDYIYLCEISEKLFGFGMDTANLEDMNGAFVSWMNEHDSETIGIEPYAERQLDISLVEDLIGMFGGMSAEDASQVMQYISDWVYLHEILEKLFEMEVVERDDASEALIEFCNNHNCETIGIEPYAERQLDISWALDLIGMFGLDRKAC